MIDHTLSLMVRKLRTRAPLGANAPAAILALPHVRRSYDPPAYLVREGQKELDRCSFVLPATRSARN